MDYFNEREFFRMIEDQNRLLHLLSVYRFNKDGNTILHKAAFYGRLSLVRQLIEWGTILDQKNSAGETALTYALLAGHREAARLLIQHGADVNVRPIGRKQRGATPLEAATVAADEDMVELLLDAGCSLDQEKFLDNIPMDEVRKDAASDPMAALLVRLHDSRRPPSPPSLQHFCRNSLRAQLRKRAKGRDIWDRVESLSCPKLLKAYLTFRTPSDID